MGVIVPIKKSDDELQIVYAEVYVPNVPDSQQEFMTCEGVRKAAHKFLKKGFVNKVDTQHNGIENGSYVVESFIARKDDPDFIADSWVVGVHIPDGELWSMVKKGELNGFSMEALVTKTTRKFEVEIPEFINGMTDTTKGHSHQFRVNFDDEGALVSGVTDSVEGHFHPIKKATMTEDTSGHTHRFSFLEDFISV